MKMKPLTGWKSGINFRRFSHGFILKGIVQVPIIAFAGYRNRSRAARVIKTRINRNVRHVDLLLITMTIPFIGCRTETKRVAIQAPRARLNCSTNAALYFSHS